MHLATWEQILLVHHLQGRSFAEAANMDEATAAATEQMTAETGLNDFFYQRDRDRPLAQVLADFQQAHQRLLAALAGVDEARLMAPRHPDDPNSELFIQTVISDTYGHYRQHQQIIRALTA